MKMPEKEFETYAPFGVATKRFARIGFHPELDISGAMKKEITTAGPGSYDPKFPTCKHRHNVSWKLQLESQDFSKTLGYRNPRILHNREFQKTLRGPGTCDMNEQLFKRQHDGVLDDVGFGMTRRFIEENKDSFPPPDTYFRNLSQTSTILRKHFTDVPTFDWDGKVDRFKSTAPKYTLAPNRYRIADTEGIDAKLKKVVSLRGPYDLFTGPRDMSTIKNYFSGPISKPPDYYYIKPSNLDHLLTHPSKARTGKLLQAKRFPKKPTLRHMLVDISLCYRDPLAPGPAYYDLSTIDGIKAAKETLHPFNTSKVDARPPMNWNIFPGPGRYSPKLPKCQKSKRPSYVFLSKGDRSLFKPIDYKLF